MISSLTRETEQSRLSKLQCACSHDKPFVILDLETTGTNPYIDKIIQLSAIRYDINGKPTAYFNSYIKQSCHIPAEASCINGITDDMLQNAPSLSEIKDHFFDMLEGCLLVGYNVAFDLRFLNIAFDGAFEGRSYVDALIAARLLWKLDSYKLENVAHYLGLQLGAHFHDALTDCEAVAGILNRAGEMLPETFSIFHMAHTEQPSSHRQKGPSFKPSDLYPHCITSNDLEKRHPLLMKTIVFTGELSISRLEAAQMATDVGAVVKTAVSKKTDYLVVGEQDITLVGFDGMSSKEEKAYALNEAGQAKIEIICEKEFFDLIQQEPRNPEPTNDKTDSHTVADNSQASLYIKAQQAILNFLEDRAEAKNNTAFVLNKNSMAVSFFKQDESSRSLWVKIGKNGGRLEIKSGYIFHIESLIERRETLKQLSDGRYYLPFASITNMAEHKQVILDIYDYCERETKGRLFDCCHRYLECSNARDCVHTDKDFAKSCSYRKKLKQGIIFFGENRNT